MAAVARFSLAGHGMTQCDPREPCAISLSIKEYDA